MTRRYRSYGIKCFRISKRRKSEVARRRMTGLDRVTQIAFEMGCGKSGSHTIKW